MCGAWSFRAAGTDLQVLMSGYIIPLIITFAACFSLRKRLDVYSLMTSGAEDGLRIMVRIVPNLIVLLSGVYMLRASGALDVITRVLTPVFNLFGIPPETAPLVLIRPLSGSAALAVAADIMRTYGVDSIIGRTAAVMLGSTETTFYTIAVYFGAAGIKNTRWAVPAALAADITGFVMAAVTARLF